MAKKTKTTRKSQKLQRAYEPTDDEKAMADRHLENKNNTKARIKIESDVTAEGAVTIGFDHDHNPFIGQLAVMEAIGTTDQDFLNPFIGQIVNAASTGPKPKEDEINFMLSVVKGIKPRDQIEAMLGAQMAAVHMATMTFTRRLNHVETLDQQDSAEKALNKLMRTFTSQVQALHKYRSKGEQKVTVEHVHVHDGGQAVVGNITHSGKEKKVGGNG